jgi:hypothetical protein
LPSNCWAGIRLKIFSRKPNNKTLRTYTPSYHHLDGPFRPDWRIGVGEFVTKRAQRETAHKKTKAIWIIIFSPSTVYSYTIPRTRGGNVRLVRDLLLFIGKKN